MTDNGEKSPMFRVLPLVQPNPEGKPIDVTAIKTALKYGLSDAPYEDRCYAWLVVLGVFPKNPNEWPDVKQEKRDTYNLYKDLCKLNDFHTKSFPQYIKKEAFELENNSLMMLVHGDIVRTGRHIFKLPEWGIEGIEYPEKIGNDINILRWEAHIRRLERILYILGTINKAQGYMQGFNELLMPIYYTLYAARSLFNDSIDDVECLSFACIQKLISMTGITDLFTTQDKSSILLFTLKGFQEVLDHHFEPMAQKSKRHYLCILSLSGYHYLQW